MEDWSAGDLLPLIETDDTLEFERILCFERELEKTSRRFVQVDRKTLLPLRGNLFDRHRDGRRRVSDFNRREGEFLQVLPSVQFHVRNPKVPRVRLHDLFLRPLFRRLAFFEFKCSRIFTDGE